MPLLVRNPATGETLGEVPAATADEVREAVARARAAQPAWAALGAPERARRLRALQREMVDARRELAELVMRETGKPYAEAMGSDVLAALENVKWCAKSGPRALAPERIRLSNPLFATRGSWLHFEPLGVIGIISPWNYPLGIPASNVAHALMAGNTVVLKPASFTPLVMLKLRELATRAGIPEEAFIVVPGSGPEAGQALIDAPIDHLIFTGSVPVGTSVEARLRERGVDSTMELGGSDPAIVLDDADVDLAARGIVWGRFTNNGQTCAAVKRAFVPRALHDAFVAKVVERVQALRLGAPSDPNVDLGCLTDPRSVAEMEAFVADARKRGARVVAGGHARPDLGPQYFEPTVVIDLPPDARLLTEECFGPILPIVPYENVDDAVRLANASRFGLAASVWGRDTERAREVARRLDAGTVLVNDVMYTFAAGETPWGGVKESGHGLTHGALGLRQLTRMKHVNVTPARAPSVWWFPYGAGLRDTYDRGAEFLYGSGGDKARTAAGVAANVLRRLRR